MAGSGTCLIKRYDGKRDEKMKIRANSLILKEKFDCLFTPRFFRQHIEKEKILKLKEEEGF